MKSLGVVRKVDKLRRLAIPVEVRKLLNLKDGDLLEFFKDDEGVIIKKHNSSLKEKIDEMECKECKWIEISNFVFPDGSNSIICNKYNKHLGFTNKNGEITETKFVDECKLRTKEIGAIIGEAIDLNRQATIITVSNGWALKVNEHGQESIIYLSKYKSNAIDKMNMFIAKKSWIPGIGYQSSIDRWVCRISKGQKTREYIGSFKSFADAKRALREAAIKI